MPVVVPQIGTAEGAEVAIGGPGDILVAGNTFDREYQWEDFDDQQLGNFTGFDAIAEVFALTAPAVALITAIVSPTPGDVTGRFRIVFSSTDTTALGGVTGLKWRLVITDPLPAPDVVRHLICADFFATVC